mmetsp:Transcript_11919/g.16155  ORF Transcript_11919/g.16155 Transcript_11919/m.16155 type:complete len:363 (-) Transcript_11919:332-1420(-)|eukprot:CAMPEP_0196587650 /NCGR_PEP_ID=MMETSP1081-20130531/58153_1 /TAXON_ID=36882 /ORGANISM="Pyramimonas amylifera, Strain CCMP720" /LENGTH=362 /DNA_ID=CAMNT_0041909893 /DNA_START=62 /DNA_END=1150 /DNA_ORIENTATION=+
MQISSSLSLAARSTQFNSRSSLYTPSVSSVCRPNDSNRKVTCMGLGFHTPDNSPHEPKSKLILPTKQLDANFGTLSPKQLAVMGLTGKYGQAQEPEMDPSLLTAKAAYRTEMGSVTSSDFSRVETSMRGGGGGGAGVPSQAPPDLPSLLLNSRICFLGMPLVPAVTELLLAELLFLGYDAPEKPVYFYINSPGSQTADGQSVGFETEAYAILDTMRYIESEVHTVCLGKAWGNAAMLLASGKKGARHSLPHSSIITQPPRLNRVQDCATNIMIKANEIIANTDTYAGFLSEFTGKEKEQVMKDIGRKKWFTPEQAIEYGLIDKVVDNQGLNMERKDYDMMLQAAQARASGGPQAAQAGGGMM